MEETSEAIEFDTTDFYKELKLRNFASMAFVPDFKAHVMKTTYYPIIVDESMQTSLLTITGSPILHKSEGRIRALKTKNVLSVKGLKFTFLTKILLVKY